MSLFTVAVKERLTVIKCPKAIDTAAATDFAALSQPWLAKPTQVYVLDFSAVESLDPTASRAFVLFHQALKAQNCFLFSTNVKPSVASVISANGLDSIFSTKASMQDVLDSAGIKVKKSVIDVEFVNPFVKATQATLETQANTKVKFGKPYLKKENDPFTSDIAGVISLTSQAFQGSIAICFPEKVFLAIYSNMLGEKFDTITKELEDAAGELLNIIFGQAKAQLNDKANYAIQKAIPTIVRGSQISVHHLTRNVAMILPFETDAGVFHLEISTEIP